MITGIHISMSHDYTLNYSSIRIQFIFVIHLRNIWKDEISRNIVFGCVFCLNADGWWVENWFSKLKYFLCWIDHTFCKSDEGERKCVDGKSYFDGCNNCFCSNGHTACTLKLCRGPDGVVSRQPPPDDFFES